MSSAGRPTLLLVGGGGGLVGRAVLREFGPSYRILSVHRRHVPNEVAGSVEWYPGDVAGRFNWRPLVRESRVVLTLAWYRWESEYQFRALRDGLLRVIEAAQRAGVSRLLHVSVPAAPPELESGLPYLRYKREVDRAIESSGLPYRILRPTMLYGPGDKLIGVLLRLIERYGRLPMFGDGRYHVSPVSVDDLARALRLEAERSEDGTVDVGGPVRYRYRDLTDLLFQALDKPPKYFRLRPSNSVRLASLLSVTGSTLLYPYEVRWLLSDRLGLPPYPWLDRPLRPLAAYLPEEVARIRARAG
jgi:uncharacterized protein YbjT (DUF2867 family)